MATIWDVSKLAGVSKSTVSRVMNNGAVSPEARKAVLAAIEKLNYEPSCFAKNIRTQRSMTIAFMIPDSSNFFYNQMFKAIEKVAFKNEYMVILCDTRSSTESELAYAKKLVQRRIDGLIYCTYKMDTSAKQFFVDLSKQLPIVFLDDAFKKVDNNISIVATDGFTSTRNAVKFLYHKGRRQIAYLNFAPNVRVTLDRYEGYLKGLEDCGLPYISEHVYFPDPTNEQTTWDIGFEGTKKLVSSGNIDAIMAASDSLAVGSLKYLKKEKIKVPDDIAIIGFDNNEMCDIVQPNLSTISQPINDIGTIAAKILFDKISDTNCMQDRVFFSGQLIQREST